ncbi:hypothetical protein J2125_004634 [Erwinia toletana]|uniref:Uncharacterized protein n=1 Tax=Winslowiella toletana TaxID=92490 RepID=A0ABS4PH10_9GAMM|nr:hypothetical protein [Winslowiella toletana]
MIRQCYLIVVGNFLLKNAKTATIAVALHNLSQRLYYGAFSGVGTVAVFALFSFWELKTTYTYY